MTSKHSRRNFLRGQLSRPEPPPLRPPGAQRTRFSQLCTGCGDCLPACPEAIILRAQGPSDTSMPLVDFSQGACTFCGACAEACQTDALQADAVPEWPWKAIVKDGCLSLQGISCRACEDACAPRAITFRPMIGGRARPDLDQAQCIGCGACASVCPSGAIAFELPDTPEEDC